MSVNFAVPGGYHPIFVPTAPSVDSTGVRYETGRTSAIGRSEPDCRAMKTLLALHPEWKEGSTELWVFANATQPASLFPGVGMPRCAAQPYRSWRAALEVPLTVGRVERRVTSGQPFQLFLRMLSRRTGCQGHVD